MFTGEGLMLVTVIPFPKQNSSYYPFQVCTIQGSRVCFSGRMVLLCNSQTGTQISLITGETMKIVCTQFTGPRAGGMTSAVLTTWVTSARKRKVCAPLCLLYLAVFIVFNARKLTFFSANPGIQPQHSGTSYRIN